MKHSTKFLALSILVASPGLSSAQAPSVPSSGDLIKQAKPVTPVAEPSPLPAVATEPYAPPLKADDKVTVLVKRFEFNGNRVFDAGELNALVAPFVNQQLGVNKLKAIASQITRYYRDRGYFVARAYLPQQLLNDGMVTIDIVEGRYGEFEIQNSSLVQDKEVQAFMDELKVGGVVSAQSLERQMLLINELAGVAVTNAEAFPGQEVGASDFRVTSKPTKEVTGYAVVDNYGSRYTGEHRLSAGVTLNSLTGIGDRLTFSGLSSDTGSQTNGGLSYDRPLGYRGLKGGVSYSQTRYALDQIANYEGTGLSESVGVYASYPLLKTRARAQDVRIDLSHKSTEDRSGIPGSVASAEKLIDSVQLSFNDRRSTDLMSKPGRLFSTLSATGGRVIMDNAVAVARDADLQSAGKFAKANLNLTHTQLVSRRLQLTTTFKSQWSFGKNLDSSEDLSVGGSNGVRAYEDSELSGDKGVALSMDLAYSLPAFSQVKSHQVSLFVDTAKVWKNDQPLGLAENNARRLNAAGIGYAMSFDRVDMKASWARGFGSQKTPASEAEFSTSLNKVLIQGTLRF
jgi:hemolysin activation/secretion protein